MKSREEKDRRKEEKELEESRYRCAKFRKVVKHRILTNDLWLGQENGKGCQMHGLRSISHFLLLYFARCDE